MNHWSHALIGLILLIALVACGENKSHHSPFTKGELGGIDKDEGYIPCVNAAATDYEPTNRGWYWHPDIVYDPDLSPPLTGDLYLPSSGGPFPVVLFVHGGGWLAGDKRLVNSRYWGEFLACRGYAFYDIEYRLSPEVHFPQQIRDCKCALSYLRGNADTYNLDPYKFAVTGGSAGGHLTAMLALTSDDERFNPSCRGYSNQSVEFQAAIPFYGVFDWTEFYPQYAERGRLGEQYLWEEEPDEDLLKKASPIYYVTPQAPPFLIIHGVEDCLADIEQSRSFYKALDNAGVDVSLVEIPGASHIFDVAYYSDFNAQAAEEIEEFLERVFKK